MKTMTVVLSVLLLSGMMVVLQGCGGEDGPSRPEDTTGEGEGEGEGVGEGEGEGEGVGEGEGEGEGEGVGEGEGEGEGEGAYKNQWKCLICN